MEKKFAGFTLEEISRRFKDNELVVALVKNMILSTGVIKELETRIADKDREIQRLKDEIVEFAKAVEPGIKWSGE